MPKMLAKYASRIAEYENDTATDNGHWVYYKRGWKSASDPMGCQHQEHEQTVTELARCVREAIPCDCGDCHA